MSTQVLTYLFVGASFALYIGIAIWSKAQSTNDFYVAGKGCLLYTSPSPRDKRQSRMPSSA